jgi:hypothetical protein
VRPLLRLVALLALGSACRERPANPAPAPAASPAPTPAASDRAAAATLAAAPWDTAARALAMPRVVRDFCEGEACGKFHVATLVACVDLELRAADSTGAPVVARVAAGDTLASPAGNLHVVSPGLAVLTRDFRLADATDVPWVDEPAPMPDTVTYASGDTVYLLEYGELGWRRWWYRGRVRDGPEFWRDPALAPDDTTAATMKLPARLLRAPVTVWWVRLRARDGREGWWPWPSGRRGTTYIADLNDGDRCDDAAPARGGL